MTGKEVVLKSFLGLAIILNLKGAANPANASRELINPPPPPPAPEQVAHPVEGPSLVTEKEPATLDECANIPLRLQVTEDGVQVKGSMGADDFFKPAYVWPSVDGSIPWQMNSHPACGRVKINGADKTIFGALTFRSEYGDNRGNGFKKPDGSYIIHDVAFRQHIPIPEPLPNRLVNAGGFATAKPNGNQLDIVATLQNINR